MQKVKIIGGAMTKFGRHMDRNLKSLVAEAVNGAFKDSGVTKDQLGGVWVGNASQGVLQGQESIRGQVVMRAMGIGGIPVVNVENACASSATARRSMCKPPPPSASSTPRTRPPTSSSANSAGSSA